MKSFYLHAWNLTLEMPYGFCLGRYTLYWGLRGSSSVACRSHAATSARCKQCLKHFLWTLWCNSQSPLRLGRYSHLILDEGIGTETTLYLKTKGWASDLCSLTTELMPLTLQSNALLMDLQMAAFAVSPQKGWLVSQGSYHFLLSLLWGMMETDVPEEPILLTF